MRRFSYVFLISSFILIGCSQGVKLESFDNSDLKEELKAEGISPKLPSKFPISIIEFERHIPPHESDIYEVSFIGENGEEFALTINPAPVEYNGFEKEEVTINGNSGFYTASELFGTSVHWTEDNYHYILHAYTTEEMMIEIAESFR